MQHPLLLPTASRQDIEAWTRAWQNSTRSSFQTQRDWTSSSLRAHLASEQANLDMNPTKEVSWWKTRQFPSKKWFRVQLSTRCLRPTKWYRAFAPKTLPVRWWVLPIRHTNQLKYLAIRNTYLSSSIMQMIGTWLHKLPTQLTSIWIRIHRMSSQHFQYLTHNTTWVLHPNM